MRVSAECLPLQVVVRCCGNAEMMCHEARRQMKIYFRRRRRRRRWVRRRACCRKRRIKCTMLAAGSVEDVVEWRGSLCRRARAASLRHVSRYQRKFSRLGSPPFSRTLLSQLTEKLHNFLPCSWIMFACFFEQEPSRRFQKGNPSSKRGARPTRQSHPHDVPMAWVFPQGRRTCTEQRLWLQH